MFKFRIERAPAPMWTKPLIPIVAILVTFLITSILIILAKANPLQAYYHFLITPLSSTFSALEVLVKATPLILTGIAVTFAFTSGYFNIGAEGQLAAGAIAATWVGITFGNLSPIIAIPLMIIGGFVAGMAWALIPAILKVKLKVDEVVTTLLMNSIIVYFISWLLNGPWRDPISNWPQSPDIGSSAIFFRLIPKSRLHIGFIIALIVVVIVYFLIKKTPLGLRMRASGASKTGAEFAGINVSKTIFIAALVSGGIAGLAGVSEVAGIHYHLIDSISNELGYTGIIVATLGGLHPIGVAISALFIGLIDTGSQTVSRMLGVPVYLGNVVQSALLLVTLGMLLFQNYRIKRL
ncbi:MAG: simple sugar transport system permease protein [Chloroflexi bacterium]|nr:MAG: simple sugar transport system permease protein [Chloroflexota bacterium]